MKQNNLKKLIATIENPDNYFNYGDTEFCLGGYAKKLLGLDKSATGVGALMELLEIDTDTARNLFWFSDDGYNSEVGRVSREEAIELLKSYLKPKRRMNREGARKLVKAVKEAEVFNWRNINNCLGGLAQKIVKVQGADKIKCLSILLGITANEADNLYTGKDLDGNTLFDFTSQSSLGNREDQRQIALKYLRQFTR